MPLFVNGAEITAEGQSVIEYVEGKIGEALKDVEAMNSLPGYMRHYHVNVMSMQAYDSADWLREFNYSANVAWGEVQQLREAENREQAQDAGNKALTEALDTMKAELEALRAELAGLKKKPGKKPEEGDSE